MYEQYFGLTEKPFSIQPDPAFLYWGRTHRLAYAMLEYGVLNHAGISVITGEVGCGKTTLIHRLLDQLSDTHTVALLSNIQEGRGDLLSWVLMGFGQAYAGKTHVELFSQLQNFFVSEYAKGRRVVLVIDEAQNLSTDMLEELRLLSNINAGKDQLLQLILAGQPQLKDLLNKPELLQLAQRIGADFHLTPLNREEVHSYIETRLSIAGSDTRLFTDRAMDLVAEESRGVPRVINIIADTALVYAFSAEERVVGVETVRNVVRDKMEFGVFGLASDEHAAAPLKASDNAGLEAFAPSTSPKEANDASTTRDPDDDHPPSDGASPASPNSAPQPAPQPAPAQPRPEPAPAIAQTPVAAPGPSIAGEPAIGVMDTPAPVSPPRHAPPGAPLGAENAEKETSSTTGVVVIGKSGRVSPEAAIRSAGDGRAIVFVSEASAADARSIARKSGAVITDIADHVGATEGRLRNAGYRQLKKISPRLDYVQFLAADEALSPDWIDAAERFLARRPEVAMIEGAARSAATASSRAGDDTEESEIACIDGAAALVRASAFEGVGGFRGDLIAAEMADLSIRLRRRGNRVWRLDAPMAIVAPRPAGADAWWRRAVRRGYENAYGASLHGGPPERLGVAATARAVVFGGVAPLLTLLLAGFAIVVSPALFPATPRLFSAIFVVLLAALLYVGAALLAARRVGLKNGFGNVAATFGELVGACRFWFGGKPAQK